MAKQFSFLCVVALLFLNGGQHAYGGVPDKFKNPPAPGGVRSIYQPFIPSGDVNSLEILCRKDMGNVLVEIQDEAGNVVYTDNIQATTNSTWSISVEGWALGDYTLSFTTVAGAVYLWEFELVEE